MLSSSATAQDDNHTVYVKVFASEDLNFRAENIPANSNIKKSGSRGRSTGFAEDGNYGTKEVDNLIAKARNEILTRFEKTNWVVTENSKSNPKYILQVMIIDARNNAPTKNQLRGGDLKSGQKPGGATLVAKLTLSSDASKSKTYVYSEYDKGRAISLTWSGAFKAFDIFAKKLVKDITDEDLNLNGSKVSF